MKQLAIEVKCVGCGHTDTLRLDRDDTRDIPMCSKCFSPMVVVRAVKS